MVMISERPAEVDDRAVPGHWESDLILGEGGRSAVGTLVERTTRLLLLLHLGQSRSADCVEAAMRKAIRTVPAELRCSIAWDQGAEMANHASFSIDRHPYLLLRPQSPWQRGSMPFTSIRYGERLSDLGPRRPSAVSAKRSTHAWPSRSTPPTRAS